MVSQPGTVVEVGWSDLELFGDETLMWLVGLVKDDEEDDTILELSICCDEGTWFDEVPMKMDCDEVAIADLFLLPDGDASLSLVEVQLIVKGVYWFDVAIGDIVQGTFLCFTDLRGVDAVHLFFGSMWLVASINLVLAPCIQWRGNWVMNPLRKALARWLRIWTWSYFAFPGSSPCANSTAYAIAKTPQSTVPCCWCSIQACLTDRC